MCVIFWEKKGVGWICWLQAIDTHFGGLDLWTSFRVETSSFTNVPDVLDPSV